MDTVVNGDYIVMGDVVAHKNSIILTHNNRYTLIPNGLNILD